MAIKYIAAANGCIAGIFTAKYTEIYPASGIEVALFDSAQKNVPDSVNGEGLSDSEIVNMALSGGKVVISQAQAFSLRFPRPTMANTKAEIIQYCERHQLIVGDSATKAELLAEIAVYHGE